MWKIFIWHPWPWVILVASLLILFSAKSAEISTPPGGDEAAGQTFAAKGVVLEVGSSGKTVVIKHEAISNYMDAMTMPFKVRVSKDLAGLHAGDEISFQLHVTENASWVDQIVKTGTTSLPPRTKPVDHEPPTTSNAKPENHLLDYQFTNELGQAVRLNSFRGQALAITFFYTRCPLPEFCPRLSKNFQEASQKLGSLASAPSNWHFLSISFDPKFDTPAMLKAYGQSYQYDPAHWSFLTGPPDKIAELAHASGMTYEADNGSINHNFRTLIVDATGHLQMVFPTGGDLSDQIVAEIFRATAATNQIGAQNQNP